MHKYYNGYICKVEIQVYIYFKIYFWRANLRCNFFRNIVVRFILKMFLLVSTILTASYPIFLMIVNIYA